MVWLARRSVSLDPFNIDPDSGCREQVQGLLILLRSSHMLLSHVRQRIDLPKFFDVLEELRGRCDGQCKQALLLGCSSLVNTGGTLK